ncbi:protein of unknown function [Nitrospina watsonii]|uniref:Uncharacterized protein n=1 Tax=Nitrospina watsonii TaxID=1323948 RepID=A0ABN8VVJ1_9BACT|nr:protein of unknown function [Nitrospina watsonii]
MKGHGCLKIETPQGCGRVSKKTERYLTIETGRSGRERWPFERAGRTWNPYPLQRDEWVPA